MARNKPVFVYDKNCQDFTTTGLAGDLRPLSAFFDEEKNGICQVVIRLPYDKYKRWKQCKVGNIIKCQVPVRMPPAIANDEYANTTEHYSSTPIDPPE